MLRDEWPPYVMTAAEMRALERAAIESGAVTGLELMERAGQGVVEAILAEWPDIEAGAKRAVVLCGPGNNGGDGFVVARLLKGRGWAVEVFLYGDPERLPLDARVNFERWREMGEVRPIAPDDPSDKTECDARLLRDSDFVVDAVFGIGLTRPAEGLRPVESILHTVFHDGLWWTGQLKSPRFVAIDVPSGLDADSGRVLSDHNRDDRYEDWSAHLTVTFDRPKLGHLLADGPRLCTNLRVVDIGLPAFALDHHSFWHQDRSGVRQLRSPVDDWAIRRGLSRPLDGHKFTQGHVLVISGPATRTGAARLAARAALRVGAGLVTVGAPEAALPEHAARLDAIMLRQVGDAAEVAAAIAEARVTATCVGPALGLDDRASGIVAAMFDHHPHHKVPKPPGRRVVLDADALTLLARDAALFALLTPACVLTPHAGEFARLFPDLAARLDAPAVTGPAYSKVDATRHAAARAGCTVLFKGPDTVIADETGRAAIHAAVYDRAAPWLATAGSGDVLAGLIAGLLARGFRPFDAACTAAWLHVEAARAFGPGLIAEDLPEMIPRVFRDMGL